MQAKIYIYIYIFCISDLVPGPGPLPPKKPSKLSYHPYTE